MKDGAKHIFSLLFLDLKVSFRFDSFSSALRRGFSVSTSMFFSYFCHIPCTTKVEKSVLQAGRAEAALWLPGCETSSWGSGCFSLAWLRHDTSKFVPGQLKHAGVHGIGISIKAEVNSVIPGHCSEKKLHFLKAEL